jgi:hypothetical protein
MPFCVRPIGSMNSNNRMSPGVGLGISLVVVDDFDICRTSLRPDETDPPLLVGPDGMLTDPVVLQCLESIVGRHGKVPKYFGVVQHSKLAQRRDLNVLGQGPAELTEPVSPVRKLTITRAV